MTYIAAAQSILTLLYYVSLFGLTQRFDAEMRSAWKGASDRTRPQ